MKKIDFVGLLAFVVSFFSAATAYGAYTFRVDDEAHIGSVVTVTGENAGTFSGGELVYSGFDDLIFYPASDCSIVKITRSGFSGETVPTSQVMGGTMVSLSSLQDGDTYYITTVGSGQGNEPGDSKAGWFFRGPRGLVITYSYNQNNSYSYSDGGYLVDDLEPYSSTVSVMVGNAASSDFEIENVTEDATGTVYTPSMGIVSIPVNETNYSKDRTFTVNTREKSAGETLTFSARLMNGNWYDATIYVGNTEYDFYSNPVSITVDASADDIFITSLSGARPYKVTVDGSELPESSWSYNDTYFTSGYTLTPGSSFYPSAGGMVEIYMENPDARSNSISFTFLNDGTEGFISDLKVGNTYLRGEELEGALAQGLEIPAGTEFSLSFNLKEYSVERITVNGTIVSNPETGYNTVVNGNLDFVFDVTKLEGNTVRFVVPQCYEGVLIYDRNNASEAITLPSGDCSLEFGRGVSEIKVEAAPGYEMSREQSSMPVMVSADGETAYYFGGTYFEVVDGMQVDITIKVDDGKEPEQKFFTIYSSADVLEFSGVTAEGTPSVPAAVYTEGNNVESGYYTVTNLPYSLTGTVMENFRQEYVIDYVDYAGEKSYSPNGYSFSIPSTRIEGNASFTVVFKSEVETPRYVTLQVTNPSCVKRIYNNNSGNITDFPANYNLNDGLQLTIETAPDSEIVSVTCDSRNLVSDRDEGIVIISLDGVEEGDVVIIDAVVKAADMLYTFEGPEGLSITYNGLAADYDSGRYLVSNVHADSYSHYPVIVSVAEGYENRLVLLDVTLGSQTWEVAGTSGIISIPGSQLPSHDATFVVNTRVPSVSETTRTVTLTIDDVDAVSYCLYQGGSSAYFSFDADGEAELTITPQQFVIQVVTTKPVTRITTDVEGTFTLPELPSSGIVLNLANVVEGQTINLFTSGNSGIDIPEADDATVVFTLQGTRIAHPETLSPGIYIVNGKKKMIR